MPVLRLQLVRCHAFVTGKCGANILLTASTIHMENNYPYFYDYPYSNNYPYTGTTPGAATDACTGIGGNVTSVHTPYGYVDVCKFPNGDIMDLYGLYNGFQGDSWYY